MNYRTVLEMSHRNGNKMLAAATLRRPIVFYRSFPSGILMFIPTPSCMWESLFLSIEGPELRMLQSKCAANSS